MNLYQSISVLLINLVHCKRVILIATDYAQLNLSWFQNLAKHCHTIKTVLCDKESCEGTFSKPFI